MDPKNVDRIGKGLLAVLAAVGIVVANAGKDVAKNLIKDLFKRGHN